MYEMAKAVLKSGGLNQYEISAFAREGLISRHNVGYWTARQFLGFGPSAFSYWEGKRFRNVANLNKYSQALVENCSPVDFEEELDPSAKIRELFVVQLRLRSGVDLNIFQTSHGNLDKETLAAISEFTDQGFMICAGHKISLSDRGVLFYDSIASALI